MYAVGAGRKGACRADSLMHAAVSEQQAPPLGSARRAVGEVGGGSSGWALSRVMGDSGWMDGWGNNDGRKLVSTEW